MSSEKLEYDSKIGGHVVLPEQIQTYRFAAARLDEMKQLLHDIKNPINNKLAFQSLPKRMRRRAMSHHPKRLPRQYRQKHISQMSKAGKPQQSKRPSRKYRRKPSNLLKEYIRRQQKNTWLETHIWHAKRFHMISKWGYKLPYSSCDKTYRACYRATTKHCLLQDISFFGCIELKGSLDIIETGFQRLTSSKCGLGITAKTYRSGKREGTIDLFKIDHYPNKALTRINFLWKPSNNILELTRTLWIFIHPSVYRDVLEEFIKLFELTKNLSSNSSPKTDDQIEVNSNEEECRTKTFSYIRTPQYTNIDTNLCLTELKDTMNRFRLTGPLSQSILCRALKCKPYKNTEPENWFKESMESEIYSNSHNEQILFWNNCKAINSPAQLIPNMILGLNIEDPRLNRPIKRSKAFPENLPINKSIFNQLSDELSQSSIWDFDIRTKISKEMLTTHELSKLRHKNALIPGERCKFEDDLQPIPVLLLQRPGSEDNKYKYLGYGCGWDIIIPSGYGLSIWLSLIMWGARPGGLREFTSINKESGQEQFLPDTISGLRESTEKYHELRMKYFKMPPNKRCNYIKYSISSPFKCPFKQLVKEWNGNSLIDDFFILREHDSLETIKNCLYRNATSFPSLPDNCLIQVYFKMKTRGNPGDFSIICLPKRNDLKRYMKNKKFMNSAPVYTEPLKLDINEIERKTLRIEHKKLLKRLRGRRVREKRRKQEKSEVSVKIRPANTKKLITDQLLKMCELWLPENIKSVRHQCSREVFGYITQSDYSFTEATVTGVGYVTIQGLRKLISQSGIFDKMVLIRGTKTRNYRFASIKINCSL